MIEHASHLGFIIAAYVVAASVVAAMILVIVSDHRSLTRRLKRFGARGLDRE